MPRGGAREGAGRKAGGVNAKHAETVAQAAAEGVTPLQVMLANMRFYHQGAEAALTELLAGKLPTVEPKEGETRSAEELSVIEGLKIVLGLRQLAGVEAARAATFMHPRFGQINDAPPPGEEEVIPLAVRLKEYARRDGLKAAGANVVDLTKKQ